MNGKMDERMIKALEFLEKKKFRLSNSGTHIIADFITTEITWPLDMMAMYVTLSRKFNIKPAAVERNIRHTKVGSDYSEYKNSDLLVAVYRDYQKHLLQVA